MNNVELQRFIEVVQANERLKSENHELREKLSELKRSVTAYELNAKFGAPAVYTDTDSLKTMKEGEE